MSRPSKRAAGNKRKKAARHHHDHAHAHPHSHHDHDAGHTHPPITPVARSAPLEQGSGSGKVLFFDAFSGLAGDMIVAALSDLGVPFDVMANAVSALALPGVTLALSWVRVSSIGAARFDVKASGEQHERTHREIDEMLQKSALAPRVKELARAIFRRLGEAEAAVHRIPIEEVHFHEVGAVDAIADIVATAAGITYLSADVVSTPLPIGRGFVECRHGTLPLPAPAVVNCLRGIPTYDAGIEAELVTPTGAAIVGTLAREFVEWPLLVPERVGWGAGTRVLPDRPNALRIVLGTREQPRNANVAATHIVLEANVDDMTGELLGHAISVLIAGGALDAWATPSTMKKGRPGFVLSVLGRAADREHLAEILLRETTSIGVRYSAVGRVERPRTLREVMTPFGAIAVKVSTGPYGEPVAKPEFDACVDAAKRAGVSVRVVIDAAKMAASRLKE